MRRLRQAFGKKRATCRWGLVRKEIFTAQDGDLLFDNEQHCFFLVTSMIAWDESNPGAIMAQLAFQWQQEILRTPTMLHCKK